MPAPPCALDLHFARWLRERRGDDTYAAISRVTGVPISTLHRLEIGQQSITLRLLDQILRRLKASPADVFPAGWRRAPRARFSGCKPPSCSESPIHLSTGRQS